MHFYFAPRHSISWLTQVHSAGWKDYYERLLSHKNPRKTIPSFEPVIGDVPDIEEEEVAQAMIEIKRGRAVGPDGILSERHLA